MVSGRHTLTNAGTPSRSSRQCVKYEERLYSNRMELNWAVYVLNSRFPRILREFTLNVYVRACIQFGQTGQKRNAGPCFYARVSLASEWYSEFGYGCPEVGRPNELSVVTQSGFPVPSLETIADPCWLRTMNVLTFSKERGAIYLFYFVEADWCWWIVRAEDVAWILKDNFILGDLVIYKIGRLANFVIL